MSIHYSYTSKEINNISQSQLVPAFSWRNWIRFGPISCVNYGRELNAKINKNQPNDQIWWVITWTIIPFPVG